MIQSYSYMDLKLDTDLTATEGHVTNVLRGVQNIHWSSEQICNSWAELRQNWNYYQSPKCWQRYSTTFCRSWCRGTPENWQGGMRCRRCRPGKRGIERNWSMTSCYHGSKISVVVVLLLSFCKSGGRNEPANYRGICVSSCQGKHIVLS